MLKKKKHKLSKSNNTLKRLNIQEAEKLKIKNREMKDELFVGFCFRIIDGPTKEQIDEQTFAILVLLSRLKTFITIRCWWFVQLL